ncbi:diguanylate cyclase [Magnetococcus marinus MC-1]|uniref:diguanylate cyclase n=1 Tax=Magnetococcus marinus (strain ATCC BAA-1437 / JCM 17883 / MC-1) TaxID=156889 RepID=A0L7H2_MAGMM|nr:GGDEF domain-containing protein [Magnetococcus marinus]ABK43915.1 diguanylate cyclase [Magnetococcus marinus MC-1]
MLQKLLAKLLGETQTNPLGLLLPGYHSELIDAQRAVLMISRLRLVSAIFAILTPLWVVLDLLFLPQEMWPALAVARLIAAGSFGALSVVFHRSDRLRDAYVGLLAMLTIPLLFFIYSHALFSEYPLQLSEMARSLVTGYAFLPFVMVAGLGVFPLTALEGILFMVPAMAAEIFIGSNDFGTISSDAHLGLIWLLALIGGVTLISAMSQLHFFSEIIHKSSHDPLTTAYTRGTGLELMEKYFLLAERSKTPLSLMFIDLDNFKSINDAYGHDRGDEVLKQAASAILTSMRRVDFLVRWGGEEFIAVLPNTKAEEIVYVQDRLADVGLGLRPDGAPVTASLGLAELISDQAKDLESLIELADKRMYLAKQSGKNRICFGDNEEDMTPSGLFI